LTRLFVAGDLFPDLPGEADPFVRLRPLLATADVVAANCEGVYCDTPHPAPTHKHFMVAPVSRGSALADLPVQLMSCANNHAMDAGADGLFSTMAHLRSAGIQVVGAGRNLAEALRPAVLTHGDLRVAFVAYASVFPHGYEARAARPGIAPLRVETFYSAPDPNFWEPGAAPRVTTVPLPGDLALVRSAIERARNEADVVVALPHWGTSSSLEALEGYEVDLARDAVDHGADIVVCCHHHSLRGVEFRRGRPIFYGIGTLVHHLTAGHARLEKEIQRRRALFGDQANIPDPGFPHFPFHADARMTGVAAFDVSADGVAGVGFVPARILADGSTEPLRPDDPRTKESFEYLSRITADRGFTTTFELAERDGWAWFRLTAAVQETPQPRKVQ
jgi:capsule synthesis protein PGA_cap